MSQEGDGSRGGGLRVDQKVPHCIKSKVQGVHKILCFFEDFKIHTGLWPLSVSPSPWCQCVYTIAGQVQKENTIFNENSVLDYNGYEYTYKATYTSNLIFFIISKQLLTKV